MFNFLLGVAVGLILSPVLYIPAKNLLSKLWNKVEEEIND